MGHPGPQGEKGPDGAPGAYGAPGHPGVTGHPGEIVRVLLTMVYICMCVTAIGEEYNVVCVTGVTITYECMGLRQCILVRG